VKRLFLSEKETIGHKRREKHQRRRYEEIPEEKIQKKTLKK